MVGFVCLFFVLRWGRKERKFWSLSFKAESFEGHITKMLCLYLRGRSSKNFYRWIKSIFHIKHPCYTQQLRCVI